MSATRSIPAPFKVVIYLIVVMALGAAISPLVFKIGKGLASVLENGGYQETPVLGFLYEVASSSEFSRYFKRSMMLAALICLFPTLRWVKASGPLSLGLRKNPDRWAHFGFGLAMASGFLLIMGLSFYEAGAYKAREADFSAWVTAGMAAAGASAIEEFLFRGCLLALALKSFRTFPALVFVTTLFAAVHFLNPPPSAEISESEVGWNSGFWMVGKTFAHFTDAQFLIAEFSTLFAVGWVLAIARMRTGSLWLPIGLHAGWIFGLKIFSSYFGATRDLSQGEWLPWIGVNIKIGITPLIIVSLTGVLVVLLFKKVDAETDKEQIARNEAK